MEVIGYVTRRRCCGKNLAFADIQVEKCSDEMTSKIIGENAPDKSISQLVLKVVFQRDSGAWNNQFDNTFPSKNSKLPYGSKVKLILKDPVTEEDHNFQVCEWELLINPKEEALRAAKEDGSDGISCTLYLKSRGNAYLRFNDTNEQPQSDPRPPKSKSNKANKSSETAKTDGEGGEFSHGDNRAKSLRAQIFASWLIETYGDEYLRKGCGVLDIAGGKGKLSIELAIQGKIQSTIIDPLVRKHGKKLEPKAAKKIRKAEAPHPDLVARPFNQTSFLDEVGQELLEKSSICVGLHPDEATEDIVDVALHHNKPLAIVPCCVFPGFFPLRRLASGAPVRTYEQFLDYILAKHECLEMTTLPFEGRNKVIYYNPHQQKLEIG